MIEQAVILSLVITAIHVCLKQGMVFGKASSVVMKWLVASFGIRKAEWIAKPLFSCLICMASVWTVALAVWTTPIDQLILLIFLVCGCNVIMSMVLSIIEKNNE